MKNAQNTRTLLSLTALLALLTFVTSAASPEPRRTPVSVRVRMQRLLGLSPQQAPPRAELVANSSDSEMLTEDFRFQADRDNWVPAVLLKLIAKPGRLPASHLSSRHGRNAATTHRPPAATD
ncbi:MAG: hypothetical protein ACR2L2_18675 [Acidobacteriota bacterium]